MAQEKYIFPVDFTGMGDLPCYIPLGNEWKIVMLTKERIVEIRRQNISEEVHICGTLTLKGLQTTQEYRSLSERTFSMIMKAGSFSANVLFTCSSFGSRPKFRLYGNVFIFNITRNRIAEGKKCVHTKSLMALSNKLEGLLDPSISCFADVLLKCGGESISAHKNILCIRSPVFAAMFRNSMKECIENEVDINDVELSVFRSMMTYIYTGKTSDLTVPLASDLLFAADKYQLEDLKRVCCDFLKDNLSQQNVLGILVLGDLHSENDLKYRALNYICDKCKKFSELEETEEWKTIMKENTALAMEILMSVVKSREAK